MSLEDWRGELPSHDAVAFENMPNRHSVVKGSADYLVSISGPAYGTDWVIDMGYNMTGDAPCQEVPDYDAAIVAANCQQAAPPIERATYCQTGAI